MARTRKTATSKSSAKPAAAKKHAAPRTSKSKTTAARGSSKKKTPNGNSAPKPSGPRLTSASNDASPEFIVRGTNDKALFTLAAYRGEGMCLLAMNWKDGTPSNDFVGFAVEYKEPGGAQFYPIPNRIPFPDSAGHVGPNALSSRLSPFQRFRWIHFPLHAGIPGMFTYRVYAVFMDESNSLSYGDYQEVDIELEAETYPNEMNICFTRGFISSQAFTERYGKNGGVGTILPKSANAGITFTPTDPKAEEALAWMGFEARSVILGVLDAAVADSTAQVRIAAYDFNDPEIVSRLEQLGDRLKIIIDDSGSHKGPASAESKAAEMLTQSAGADNVQRQHMGGLQHNKVLIVDGDSVKYAIGGSTNFSWRGIYVQNNNAVALQGETAVKVFTEAFENLWANPNNTSGFHDTDSAVWNDLGFSDVDAKVTFSPHSTSNAALKGIADDIMSTESTLFYSLAFLYETKGVIQDAIKDVTKRDETFVYGLSDKSVGGLDLLLPNGNPPIAFPNALTGHAPPPFEDEATGGSGTRLHHKFVVIDFDKPTARVYTGSHNFSVAADTKNGENLFLIRDQRSAVSYMIEGLSMFDHYQFRDLEVKSKTNKNPLELQLPPSAGSGKKPWWDKYWSDAQKKHDREMFGI